MSEEKWICEICAETFDNEIDLLAHQFNSSCEKEIKEKEANYDNYRIFNGRIIP